MFLVKSCFKAWYRKSVVKILLSLKSGAFRATLETNPNVGAFRVALKTDFNSEAFRAPLSSSNLHK